MACSIDILFGGPQVMSSRCLTLCHVGGYLFILCRRPNAHPHSRLTLYIASTHYVMFNQVCASFKRTVLNALLLQLITLLVVGGDL
jgi:hypothetical protein